MVAYYSILPTEFAGFIFNWSRFGASFLNSLIFSSHPQQIESFEHSVQNLTFSAIKKPEFMPFFQPNYGLAEILLLFIFPKFQLLSYSHCEFVKAQNILCSSILLYSSMVRQ